MQGHCDRRLLTASSRSESPIARPIVAGMLNPRKGIASRLGGRNWCTITTCRHARSHRKRDTSHLKPRKARPFYGRHPWVLDSAIDRVEGDPADGDVVDLLSDKGKFIARGIFNSRSRIRVRLYTWDAAEPLDDAFWRRRLESAIALPRATRLRRPAGRGPAGLQRRRRTERPDRRSLCRLPGRSGHGAGDGRAAAADRADAGRADASAGHHDPHRARRQPGRRASSCATARTGARRPTGR